MLEIVSAHGGLAKKYKIHKGDRILAFDGYKAEDELDYIYYDSKPSFKILLADSKDNRREIAIEKSEDESLNLVFKKTEKIHAVTSVCSVLSTRWAKVCAKVCT